MDPSHNPFVPGAGAPPPELSGRAALLDDIRAALARTRRRIHAKGFIAVGLRGVGKTVLLREAQRIAIAADFRTCFVELEESNPLGVTLAPHLRRLLLELDTMGRLAAEVKRGLRVLKSFLSGLKLTYGEAALALDVDPERGAADSGSLDVDLPDIFAALGKAALARETQVALFVDEVQYLPERDLGALIKALHRCAQEQLPVIMIAAGLPQVVGLTGRAKSYAERMFDFPELGALPREDADRAVTVPAVAQDVTVTPSALDAIHEVAQGYPYFIQEVAYHTWNAAPGPTIDERAVAACLPEALRRLDASFFRVRFDRLTPREKTYLRAMASLPPDRRRTGDIAAQLAAKPTTLAPLRSGLIGKGMIYSPSYGETAFTVPMFDEYLCRIMPDFSPGATGGRG